MLCPQYPALCLVSRKVSVHNSVVRFYAAIQCPLLKDFIGWLLYTFPEQLTGYLKEPVAMHLKEQIPRTCIVVVQHFPSNKSQSLPGWSFPKQLSPWPSPLHHAWNSQRKGERCRQQCPLSGSDQGFIVRKSPFSGTSLFASSNQPSPTPSPLALTSQRFQGFIEMKSCSSSQKKIGGDKVINTYFVRKSIRATILEHSFGLLEG